MPTFIKTGLWETSTTAQVPKGWLNLTKLIKDNSGGATGNINDYSIDEIEVGKFIYINDNGDKVSKPKYRKVIQIDNSEGIITGNIDLASYITDFEKLIKPIDLSIYNNGEYLYGLICFGYYSARQVSTGLGYCVIEFIDNTDRSTIINPYNGKYEIIAEYTKTTDTETIIELAV